MMPPTAALSRFTLDRRRLVEREIKSETIRYGFAVATLSFLLKSGEKVEVIDAIPACPIPNTPQWFAGMINVRGNLLPVFDLKLLLDLELTTPSRWIMIFGQGSAAAGIHIDTLPTAVHTGEPITPPPAVPELLRACTTHSYREGETHWIEVSFEAFFAQLRTKF
ncbi:MAG TPA: chemotaxis protein CheW [Gammaproteobacteria bacterium]|nr:chemotaxis protein CheW [Gammaproteobacteria bacterium]